MSTPGLITPVVDDVLVNRRRGRFAIAFDGSSLLLCQHGHAEALDLGEIADADAAVTDGRVRLRFRYSGAQWTLRWFDGPTARTSLLLDVLDTRLG